MNAQDVIMVMNPVDNKLINVKPLFELNSIASFGDIAEQVDNAIRTIACACEYDDIPVDPSNLCFYLFEIRNMFTRLTECAISMPEKKGGKQ